MKKAKLYGNYNEFCAVRPNQKYKQGDPKKLRDYQKPMVDFLQPIPHGLLNGPPGLGKSTVMEFTIMPRLEQNTFVPCSYSSDCYSQKF